MNAETQIHLAVVQWWSLACKAHKLDERTLFHVPNGGKRGKIEAGILKGMGLRAGVPDLLLIVPRFHRVALALELKAPNGCISPAQKEVMPLFEEAGWAVCVAWSFDEAISAITNYLKTGNPLTK